MQDQVEVYLLKVREQEKSFRAKISRVLEELETYLFAERTQVSADGAELLFSGNKDKKLKGLVELCGLPGKFGSALKNSSYTALALVLKLLTASKQKDLYMDSFLSLDGESLREMKLDLHIAKGGTEKENALKICSVIKSNRPFMEVGEYLKTTKGVQIFEEWMGKTDFDSRPAAREEGEGAQDTAAAEDDRESVVRDSSENYVDKSVVRRRLLERLGEKLTGYEQAKNIAYYRENMYDPLSGDIEESVLRRQSVSGARQSVAVSPNRCQEYMDAHNLHDMAALLHIESPTFDPDLFLTTFHADASREDLIEAQKRLQDKDMGNDRMIKLLILSSSPQVLENFVRVSSINTFLQKSSIANDLTTLDKEQTKILNSFSASNQELTEKETLLSAMLTVKGSMNKLRDYEKVLQELKTLNGVGNLAGLTEVLGSISLTELVNNKNLVIFNQLHRKFDKLISSIQDSSLRSLDIRAAPAILETQARLLQQCTAKQISPPSSERLWTLAKAQASSIVLKGEIVKNELALTREDDLVFRLKTDVYENFIGQHANVHREDLSKNIGQYLKSIAQAFQGLSVVSKIFAPEVAKQEFKDAAKSLLAVLKTKLEEIKDNLDYRLIAHSSLSNGLGELLQMLKRVYFDDNADENNRLVKQSMFKLLVKYYCHQLSITMKAKESWQWATVLSDYFTLHGEAMLTEPIFYESRNRADIGGFFSEALSALTEEFLAGIENSINSSEISDNEMSCSVYLNYLKTLHENKKFTVQVWLAMMSRFVREEFEVDVERIQMADGVERKFGQCGIGCEGRYFRLAENIIRGTLGCLALGMVNHKIIESADSQHFADLTKDLPQKEEVQKNCDRESRDFSQKLTTSIEIRRTVLHLFLFIKSEAAELSRLDRNLADRLLKLFSETFVVQIYDSYFNLQKYKDEYFEAAMVLDLEFSMLWMMRFVDQPLLEKAKRVRELALANLSTVQVSGQDFVKSLKSYLRGCKLKYSLLLSV